MIEIASAGALSVDSKPAVEQQLVELTRTAHQSNPELRVVIHADGNTPWERVVRVMDLVKQGGVDRIAFGVGPASP